MEPDSNLMCFKFEIRDRFWYFSLAQILVYLQNNSFYYCFPKKPTRWEENGSSQNVAWESLPVNDLFD